MEESNITQLYNYDAFVPEKFERWMNFTASPPLGKAVPDFPLWYLDTIPTTLLHVLTQSMLTVVEFGSFT